MTEREYEDVKRVGELPYAWDKLTGKRILLSGGTGFIGSFLCDVFRYRNQKYGQKIKIVSLSRRNREGDETVTYLSHDVCLPVAVEGKIDYVLHLASNTHPAQYKSDPVGTIMGNVFGAYNLLTLAKEKNAERFLLASSCEIYGEGKEEPMEETYSGYIDCNTARAGYNEAKRVSESLCRSFEQQYGVASCTCRLARVFGADKTKKDTKAMAQFMDNALRGEDIVLKSKGLQKYSYIYVADAVSGILKVLLDGKSGEAYNIAADYDGLTLGQYAEFIAGLAGKKVVYEITDDASVSKAQNALLDNGKIKALGFVPVYSVCEGLERTYRIYKEQG